MQATFLAVCSPRVYSSEYRLPELFCGFYRRDGEGPVPYPVACSPQSWSAASVFLLLQAILGMKIDAVASRLFLSSAPVLPEFLGLDLNPESQSG